MILKVLITFSSCTNRHYKQSILLSKMKQSYLRLILIGLPILLFISCVSPKKITYFQDEKMKEMEQVLINFEPTIQTGDILTIVVSSLTSEAALPFNLYETQGNTTLSRPLPYIVNADGIINFPGIGKIKVAHLTTRQLTDELHTKLLPYLNDPIVNVRLTNFKVTVIGEVRSPGSYTVLNERINIIEAIGLAGDLTIQGKRNSVTLIRERSGKRVFISIDLTNKELFSSPYYYLAQNDIIYVEPNKTRINSSAVGSNTTVILSSLSVLISIAALILR